MTPQRLLLDTHVFLWWRADDPQLAAAAREAIAHAEIVAVSAASAWEAAIKARLGRLRLPEPFATGVTDSGFPSFRCGSPTPSGPPTCPGITPTRSIGCSFARPSWRDWSCSHPMRRSRRYPIRAVWE